MFGLTAVTIGWPAAGVGERIPSGLAKTLPTSVAVAEAVAPAGRAVGCSVGDGAGVVDARFIGLGTAVAFLNGVDVTMDTGLADGLAVGIG
jgi:hypothetical protein